MMMNIVYLSPWKMKIDVEVHSEYENGPGRCF